MHGLASFLEQEIKWQAAEDIEATARTSNEYAVRAVQFVEEWNSHLNLLQLGKSYAVTCTALWANSCSTICPTSSHLPPASPQPIRGMCTDASNRRASTATRCSPLRMASYRTGGTPSMTRTSCWPIR